MTAPAAARPVRYRFGPFLLSPRQRLLLCAGRPRPLIPRYFDLLVYLVARRAEAVHRRDIFDGVWTDVIVSDSALSQAVRTLRRALDDDSREPRFIRTVARHGYQFVCVDVVEEADEGPGPGTTATAAATPATAAVPNGAAAPDGPGTLTHLVATITARPLSDAEIEEQRDAAEQLHALGTTAALAALDALPGDTSRARALLRDARWDAPQAGDVPLGEGGTAIATAWHLIDLRLRRAASLVAVRWAGAAIGAGVAGTVAGLAGGALLSLLPGAAAPWTVAPVLGLVGGVAGAAAGAGVGAGLAVGEAVWRSRRGLALSAGGALGGGLVGLIVQWLGRWSLAALVGVQIALGGGLEGLLLGAAAGAGYAAMTRSGGFAAPRGRDRVRMVATVAAACATVAFALAWSGHPLVGGTVHAVATASARGQAVLSPLGRLLGEPDFGPITATLVSMAEGAMFGAGAALGLTRRRRQFRHWGQA